MGRARDSSTMMTTPIPSRNRHPRRKLPKLACIIGILGACVAGRALAQAREPAAQVQLPLAAYDQMVAQAREPKPAARPAPARYALGNAALSVSIDEQGGHLSAHAELTLQVRVLEAGWVAVPLLPNGTAVQAASVAGNEVELMHTPAGLAFSTEQAGRYQLKLVYDVDAQRGERGYSLALPLPEAPSTRLQADLPGEDLDVAVIPAAAVSTQTQDDETSVQATIPSTLGVQLSWRVPGLHGHSFSRAHYRATLVSGSADALHFDAEIALELFDADSVVLPLLPSDVIVSALSVDGKPSTITVVDDAFSARVHGRGAHRLQFAFQLPVVRENGSPHVQLRIPEVPVSELELRLAGNKDVTLEPVAHVDAVHKGNNTVAHAFLPMAAELQVSWAEAVPEAASEELLANASVFHLVHAEDGVLYVRAMVVYEVTSGSSNVIQLDIPHSVQVSDIRAADGVIKKTIKTHDDPHSLLDRYSVFLDRELRGEQRFGLWLWLDTNRRGAALVSTLGGAALLLICTSTFGVGSSWPLLGSLGLLVAFGVRWLIALRRGAAVA
jgi:hypothetical protein